MPEGMRIKDVSFSQIAEDFKLTVSFVVESESGVNFEQGGNH